jgi:hypothetical protein
LFLGGGGAFMAKVKMKNNSKYLISNRYKIPQCKNLYQLSKNKTSTRFHNRKTTENRKQSIQTFLISSVQTVSTPSHGDITAG